MRTFLLIILLSCTPRGKNLEVKPLLTRYELVEKVIFSKKREIKRGEGLYHSFDFFKIDPIISLILVNKLRDKVDFSTLKTGDMLEAKFNRAGGLVEIKFSQNAVDTHVLKLAQEGWKYSFEQKATKWKKRYIKGHLKSGSTLQNELQSLGLDKKVVNEIASILSCKINFRMNARTGDTFQVLLSERIFDQRVVETKVLYASYLGRLAGNSEAFLFMDEDKSSAYNAHYTEDGEALIKSGLRYPLSKIHVRSNYGWRRHPVTGVQAFHRGVDLRAPSGRAVYSVASGKVIESKYNRFAGNKIAIKHRDKSTSYYYHLKNRIVKKGQWVKSGQIIGKVGATGRVTGAHLHFGFKNAQGRWMNPLNKRMIATPKLARDRLKKLNIQIDKIKWLLDSYKQNNNTYIFAKIKKTSAPKWSNDYFL